MTKRFQRAYDALVQAYFDGTLASGSCVACGIGNILAAALGGRVKQYSVDRNFYYYEGPSLVNFWVRWELRRKGLAEWVEREEGANNAQWLLVFKSGFGGQKTNLHKFPLLNRRLKALTGYNVAELAAMEMALETGCQIHHFDYGDYTEREVLEDQFRGLENMVTVMMGLEPEEKKRTLIPLLDKMKAHPKL